MSTIYYVSTRNAMKRATPSGTYAVAAPATSAYAGSIYITNLVIPHGQTGAPVFRYSYEPFGDGVVWPPLTDRLTGRAFNPNSPAQAGPGIIAWADSTNITIQLYYVNNTLVGTYPVHVVIYKDFVL